jgi:hypothetical protein
MNIEIPVPPLRVQNAIVALKKRLEFPEPGDTARPSHALFHEGYEPPSPDEIRQTLAPFTGSEVAKLVGVAEARQVRRWIGGEVTIPYSTWRLFLVLTERVRASLVPEAPRGFVRRKDPGEQMMELVRAFPLARKRPFFADLSSWDADRLDRYATSAAASGGDVALISFLLDVWNGESGAAWDWKTPRFSLREVCNALDDGDRAVIARWVQEPFFV